MKLYYYTSVEKLALILESRSLRFTRLDLVDDIKESEAFSTFNPLQYIFASCHTQDGKESIPLWKMYSSMESGVRLEFGKSEIFKPTAQIVSIPTHNQEEFDYPTIHYSCLKNTQIINSDYIALWGTDDSCICEYIRYKDIIYNDAFQDLYRANLKIVDIDGGIKNVIDRTVHYSPFNFGFYKTSYWAFQQESRFLIYVIPFCKDTNEISQLISENHELKTEHIDVKISNDALNHMKIRLSPKADDATKLSVKALIKEFTNVILEDSELKGQIR